jgi:hypothetical protein
MLIIVHHDSCAGIIIASKREESCPGFWAFRRIWQMYYLPLSLSSCRYFVAVGYLSVGTVTLGTLLFTASAKGVSYWPKDKSVRSLFMP